MNRSIAIVTILIAAGASFSIGLFSNRDRSPNNADKNTARISAIPKAGTLNSAADIARARGKRPTADRKLEIKAALLNLDANGLAQLWDDEHGTLDFHSHDDREFASALLRRLAEFDPQLAMEKLEGTGSWRLDFLSDVIGGWTSVDREAALAWCREQSSPRTRQRVLSAAIEEVARSDRNGAIDLYLAEVANKTLRAGGWDERDLFERWAKDSPQEAVAAARRILTTLGRDQALNHVIEGWAKFDPAAAASWISDHVDGETIREGIYVYLLSGWAGVEPDAAADFALELGGDTATFRARMHYVLDAWTRSDFNSAATWVDAITDPEQRKVAQRKLVERSKNDANHEPAFNYSLEHLDENSQMLDALKDHAYELTTQDPAAAFAWAEENLTDAEQLKEFHYSLIDHLTLHLPADAASYITALPEDYKDRAMLHERTAQRWAWEDAAAAREWAESLPEGDYRDRALIGLAEGWMRDGDRRADAAEWAASFPAGAFRDQLSDRHARALMNNKSINDAVDTAASISDPFVRDRTFEAILKVWYQDEIKAEAARNFIHSTDLVSETVKWRVLNRKWGHP